ncbi:MAG: rhodanese-like domain-containing protein [Epsilonproteobacteria bacterium]|nr:MAG: rhodanese-like domain-containing protein [Campylobacterota bacterium]
MKKFTDYFLYAAIVVAGIYLLYQKGYIFAEYPSISAKEAHNMIQKYDANTTILDVRTLQEYNLDGHLSEAVLIPIEQLSSKLDMFSPYKETKIIIYCRSGNRSVTAARILSEQGYHVYNLEGGINAWKRAHLPVETIRLRRPLR